MEETNLANKHPKVVSQIATKHEAWKRTLAPLAKIPQIVSAKPIIPKGHGWARPDNHSQKAAK